MSNSLRVEVFAVNRGGGLLTPGVIQGASIDSVESELIDKLQHDGFSCGINRPLPVARFALECLWACPASALN
jgi:hypothetical protein